MATKDRSSLTLTVTLTGAEADTLAALSRVEGLTPESALHLLVRKACDQMRVEGQQLLERLATNT